MQIQKGPDENDHEKASMLEIKGVGDIRLIAEKVDLCGGCTQRFIEFLRTRPGAASA
jgi:hypothetical protein